MCTHYAWAIVAVTFRVSVIVAGALSLSGIPLLMPVRRSLFFGAQQV